MIAPLPYVGMYPIFACIFMAFKQFMLLKTKLVAIGICILNLQH